MKKHFILFGFIGSMISFQSTAQSVYDFIASSPNHTYLTAALDQEGLNTVLSGPGTFTVFAPDNDAIDDLATALGTDIAGVLANPDLTDILTYHVLNTVVNSGDIASGDMPTPLNIANTLKLSITGTSVYVNQAMVNGADFNEPNGVVHSIDAVLLPVETVVDIALDNGFTYLAAAALQEGLIPTLSDPFATFTVLAPSNQAFDDLATALGTDIAGILANPDLTNILLYHVFDSEITSGQLTNGMIAEPIFSSQDLKVTVAQSGDVFFNQAQVQLANVDADNGVVHTLDAVLLPVETVVDVALDNNFNNLAAAVIRAELLPALTNPLGTFTVFAPTDQAFVDLATALQTDMNGLLASPDLRNILLYHVLGTKEVAADLLTQAYPTLFGESVNVDITSGVTVNGTAVVLADNMSDNGVVHVIGEVLVPQTLGLEASIFNSLNIYPNPAEDFVNIALDENFTVALYDMMGQKVEVPVINSALNLSNLPAGMYQIEISVGANRAVRKLAIR